MFARCADALVKKMVQGKIVEEEKAALYAFGFEQGFRTIWEILLVLLTGFFFHLFLQIVLILLAFIPIRIYAGGYHAKTPMRCIIETWLLMFSGMMWLRYMPSFLMLQIVVTVLLGIFLFFLCPVPDEHKKLYSYEVKRYRRKALIIYGGWCALAVGCRILGFIVVTRCIVIGFALLIVLLTAGIVKNRGIKRKGELDE